MNSLVLPAPAQGNWILGIRDQEGTKGLRVNYSVLLSKNGFTKTSKIGAIFSERQAQGELRHASSKQVMDFSLFSVTRDTPSIAEVRIEDAVLTEELSKGKTLSKGIQIEWNLHWDRAQETELLPYHSGFLKSVFSLGETARISLPNLNVSGSTTVAKQNMNWKNAQGYVFSREGTKIPRESTWFLANQLKSEDGHTLSITGYDVAPGRRSLLLNKLPAFRVRYDNELIWFRGAWDSLRSRSEESLTDWRFELERGPLSIRGTIENKIKDLFGWTRENTDGSILFTAYNPFSNLSVQIYRDGKLERSFQGFAFFEHASREKNEYVEYLL